MTRKEKISQLNDIFAEINEDDNAVCYLTSEDNELIESAIEALSQESCYNPDEWCTDCSEYNQDKHCCPRYNRVIRRAVEEIKEPNIKTGYISIDNAMSVFDDFMRGEIDEDGTNTFLEMLKDKAESEDKK